MQPALGAAAKQHRHPAAHTAVTRGLLKAAARGGGGVFSENSNYKEAERAACGERPTEAFAARSETSAQRERAGRSEDLALPV